VPRAVSVQQHERGPARAGELDHLVEYVRRQLRGLTPLLETCSNVQQPPQLLFAAGGTGQFRRQRLERQTQLRGHREPSFDGLTVDGVLIEVVAAQPVVVQSGDCFQHRRARPV